MADYNITDESYFTWDPNETFAVYKMVENEIKCINCFGDGVYFDLKEEEMVNDSVTTTVNTNLGGISINKTATKKGLSVNKDGVIIKNN